MERVRIPISFNYTGITLFDSIIESRANECYCHQRLNTWCARKSNGSTIWIQYTSRFVSIGLACCELVALKMHFCTNSDHMEAINAVQKKYSNNSSNEYPIRKLKTPTFYP